MLADLANQLGNGVPVAVTAGMVELVDVLCCFTLWKVSFRVFLFGLYVHGRPTLILGPVQEVVVLAIRQRQAHRGI